MFPALPEVVIGLLRNDCSPGAAGVKTDSAADDEQKDDDEDEHEHDVGPRGPIKSLDLEHGRPVPFWRRESA
jgi:hypothetical protein